MYLYISAHVWAGASKLPVNVEIRSLCSLGQLRGKYYILAGKRSLAASYDCVQHYVVALRIDVNKVQ